MRGLFISIIVTFLAGGLVAQVHAQTAAPTVALTRIRVTVPVGTRIGSLGFGAGQACYPVETTTWRGDRDMDTDEFQAPFQQALAEAGLKPPAGETNLFADTSNQADISVGAVISSMSYNGCRPPINPIIRYGGLGKMDVEWQVYSQVERRVVATIRTNASQRQDALPPDRQIQFLIGAFAANAKALFAHPDFKAALARPAPSAAPAASAALEPMILTAGSAGPLQISDASGSVVAILAGGGHGSGFLVSDDGHFLTNQHVVGDLKQVRIRWSDGLESVADVVRVDRRRDVALLKVASSRGRQPLRLRAGAIQPGETVTAIGTPIDPQYQNTVTRGVLSGNRILDGFSFLQSDVAVSPGNSGGPLLDDQGAVVAIAVLKDGRGENLNFFIPIRDALDFLALTVR